jgi:L-lysine 2,3-aminomutase
VASEAELTTSPIEADDPIGNLAKCPVEGIMHRFLDCVLLKDLNDDPEVLSQPMPAIRTSPTTYAIPIWRARPAISAPPLPRGKW